MRPETVVTCLVALIDGFELAIAIQTEDTTPAAVAARLTAAAAALLGWRVTPRAAGSVAAADQAGEMPDA